MNTKETLQSIIQKTQESIEASTNAQALAQKLLEEQEQPPEGLPAELNLKAFFQEGNVILEWDPFSSDQTADIRVQIDGKEFTVNQFLDDHQTPVDPEKGRYVLGKNVNAREHRWAFWFRLGDEESEPVYPEKQNDVEPVEPKPIWYGIWDKDIKEFNHAGVVHPNDAEDIVREGRNCIVSLSHTFKNINTKKFTPEEQSKWKAKIRGWKDTLEGLDVGVLIQDEPFADRPQHSYKNFSVEEIEWLIDTIHEEIGVKAGISITRNDALTGALPQNADFLMPTMYVFLTEEAWEKGHVKVTNRKEFDEYFDLIISRIRSKTDAELLVTAQGFYGDPWKKMPLEAVRWHLEAVWRNNLKGLTFWEMGKKDADGSYKGLATMPVLLEEIVSMNEKIPD